MENAVHSGGVVEEFRLHLEKLNRKFASRPRQEMLRLFLLALEREELVSVGYRESLINSRLLDMPIDDEVRDLIRHAMVWIWKDEEMHAIYIRGAIFKVGNSRLRIQSFLRQAAGGVAGWATSVLQHARWVQAPFSRALAASIAAAGSLFGKVPSDVKRHLRYGSFRDFCRFNIDAEKTARLCWERLVELAKGQPDLGVALIADFKRVVEDEGRHGRIFEILAVALDERDRLAGGETVGALLEKIRAVGEHFLPRSRRLGIPDVAVIEGRNIYDHFYRNRAVRQVAEYFDIRSPHFRIVDASEEQVPHQYSRGMAQYSIARTWRDADFRISFAKLRSHPVEHVHLSLANTEGLGMRCDHFLFAERQAQRESAVMTLLGDFPPHFALIEGYDLAPDGILGVMGSPRPRSPRRLYAGGDALAVDVVAARHLGLRDPRQSSMLRAAFHWFGDPSASIQVIGPDEPI